MQNKYAEFQEYLNITNKDRQKTYCHFDLPILPSLYLSDILKEDCSSYKQHKYYPLIQYFKTEKKYRGIKTYYKQRNIMYPSHRDSAVYQYYCFLLNQMYEQRLYDNDLSNNVLAYRKISRENSNGEEGKCNIDFAKEVISQLTDIQPGTVFCIDISKFFDNIDHKLLKKQLCSIIKEEKLPEDLYRVFKSLTAYSFVRKCDLKCIFNKFRSPICSPEQFRATVRPLIHKNQANYGIPQGTPISGLLANIYMYDFDSAVKHHVNKLDGYYRRYSDDILILLPKKASRYQEILKFISTELKKIKLDFSEEKISIINHEDGVTRDAITNNLKSLQYLGFEFNGKNVFIRSSTIARDLRKTSNKLRSKYRYQRHKDKDQHVKKYAPRKKNRYMSRAKQLMEGVPSAIGSQIHKIKEAKLRMKHILKTKMLNEKD